MAGSSSDGDEIGAWEADLRAGRGAARVQRGRRPSGPNPTGGTSAWRLTLGVDQGRELKHVSCPSPSLCVAIDRADKALVSTNPLVRHPRWTPVVIDRPLGALSPPDLLTTVACAPRGSCFVGDADGNVIVGRR
jgi:hypothetical protein